VDFMISLFGKPYSVSAMRSKPDWQSFPDYYHVRYEYPSAMVTAEASWYAGATPFQAGFRVMLQKAVIENTGGKLIVYKNDGTVDEATGSLFAEEDTGINLTSTDGYFEEQLYFKNCVLNHTEITLVKKQELLDVLDIISQGLETAVVK